MSVHSNSHLIHKKNFFVKAFIDIGCELKIILRDVKLSLNDKNFFVKAYIDIGCELKIA